MDLPRQQRSRLRRHGGKVAAAVAVFAVFAVFGVAIGRLEPAPPTVSRAGVWFGEVSRGEMLREVQGNGKLLPEHIQWVTALSAARVETIFVRPGAIVEADTILLQLRNPELELQALEAERQVAAARAELANIRATMRGQKLAQEVAVTALQVEKTTARRKADASAALGQQGYVSQDDRYSAAAQLESIDRRMGLEEQRITVLGDGLRERLGAHLAQIERLVAIAAFRREQLAGLKVRAGVAGVLQELPLEAGQWVTVGALLAKVARPDQLKAQLAIPETLVKDVTLGMRAHIDTRNGIVEGEVVRVDPAASKGTVTVDVRLEGPLPRGARPDLNVAGTVELERLPDVLYVRKPAFVQPNSTMGIYRVEEGGQYATRAKVQFGRLSASTVEIVGGLRVGDRIILSDVSEHDKYDRLQFE